MGRSLLMRRPRRRAELAEPVEAGQERLQRYLARSGLGSRRACESLIRDGRVTLNGRIVSVLGTKVTPGIDVITCDGRRVAPSEERIYVLLHKPAGVITSLSDPQGRSVIPDLLPRRGLPRLFPVGRLDYQTEGLLLLTNDGATAHALTHPSFEVEKEYLVKVKGRPDPSVLRRLKAGVVLDGHRLRADQAAILRHGTDATWLRMVVHEGRYHEIRRLCEAIGYPVLKLRRIRLGPISLGRLPRGAWRRLSPREVASLRRVAGQKVLDRSMSHSI
jgi:23S rRNA pseudouridine2605 synthase